MRISIFRISFSSYDKTTRYSCPEFKIAHSHLSSISVLFWIELGTSIDLNQRSEFTASVGLSGPCGVKREAWELIRINH